MSLNELSYTQIKSIIEHGPKALFMHDMMDMYADGHDDVTPEAFQQFVAWMSRSDYGTNKTAEIYKIMAAAYSFWSMTDGKSLVERN